MFISQIKLGRFYTEGETNPPTVPPTPPSPPTPPAKTFTQDEVNAFLAEHKRGLQKQIEDLKKNGDPAELQAKIKELSDSLLTKEELATRQATELKTQYETQLAQAKSEGETWNQRYMGLHTKQAISEAAVKHNAFDAEQLALIIGPVTKIVEVTDDKGKGTGQFKSMTTIELDGKKLELPTVEAVGKLRESNRYPNQFKVQSQSGTGTTTMNNTDAPPASTAKPPADMNSFMSQFGKIIKGQ